MADIPNVPPAGGPGATPPPTPVVPPAAGAAPVAPPRPAEAAKVQPKKETVRINLPPKPTAAPTIKIPSPSAISAAAPAAAAPVAAAPAASSAAPAATQRPAPAAAPVAAAAPKPGPAPIAARPAVIAGGPDGIDKGLAIAAAVVMIAVLVDAFLLLGKF